MGEVLLALLGRPVSASTVSRVAKTLDTAVAAFHARPLANRYRALMLDGVVLARKTGAGALKRPVLVALGIHADGKKEIIDFRLAASESAAEWALPHRSLPPRAHRRRDRGDLRRRRPGPDRGASHRLSRHPPAALLGAQDQEHPRQGADRDAVKDGLHAIMNAPNRPKALGAARRFADAWEKTYPKAVACLRNDLDDLLTCFRYSQVRTTNAIERRFREVRRRTRPMGTFQDRTSMDRSAVFSA